MPDSLFAQAVSIAAVTAAWERVRGNGGTPGGDGMSLADFATAAPPRLAALNWALTHKRYTPGPVRRLSVPKSSGTGRRTLTIPCVTDRIAQTAVAVALTAVLEPEFEPSSYAYRQGRSVQQAVARVAHLHANGYPWVVDGDIRAFFDEIPHALLLARLKQSVDDADLLALVDQWLDGFGDGGRGIAQGSPISPLLANLYLDGLDELFADGPVRIIRFADDFVLLSKSHKSAEAALARAREHLDRHGLALNLDKTKIVPFERAFVYLGHLFVRSVVLKQARETAPFTLAARSVAGPDTAIDAEWEADETAAGEVLAGEAGPLRLAQEGAIHLPREEAQGRRDTDQISSLAPQRAGEVARRAPSRRDGGGVAPTAGDDPLADLAADRDPEDFALGLAPLYLMEKGARLATANDCFTVFVAGAEKLRLPAAMVGRIDLGADVDAGSDALRLAADHRIPVAFVNGLGAAQATLLPALADYAGLHLAQAKLTLQPDRALAHARVLVAGKLRNGHALLKRLNRRRKREDVAAACEALKRDWEKAEHAADIDAARGFEGYGGVLYWRALSACLGYGFTLPRRRDDPHNPVAAVLNFTAGLLTRDMTAAVSRAGLHPGFGVLHADADYSDACVYDLVEAFRAPLSEGLAVYLFNNRVLGKDDFTPGAAAVRLTGAASRTLVETYEFWMARPVKNPRTGAFTTWRGLLLAEARALAASLRDDTAFAPYRLDY